MAPVPAGAYATGVRASGEHTAALAGARAPPSRHYRDAGLRGEGLPPVERRREYQAALYANYADSLRLASYEHARYAAREGDGRAGEGGDGDAGAKAGLEG